MFSMGPHQAFELFLANAPDFRLEPRPRRRRDFLSVESYRGYDARKPGNSVGHQDFRGQAGGSRPKPATSPVAGSRTG